MAVITTQRLEICREENHEILIDVLILINVVMYIHIFVHVAEWEVRPADLGYLIKLLGRPRR